MNVVGYVRVSTAEQAGSGLGLAAQRKQIQGDVERRGWQLLRVEQDAGASGKSLVGRPGLQAALDAVESGVANGIVVAKLDRLSRSLLDFARLMERSRKRGFAIVALDLGVDTTTPSGEFMVSVLASAAQWERRIIGQRTKDALAIKRAQGVKLGRPRTVPEDVAKRIARMRADGMTLRGIADSLNNDGVPTGQGGARWHASVVRNILLAEPSLGALP